MTLQRIIFVVFMGICFWACSHEREDQQGVDIDLNKDIKREILFSSFVDSITYIHLETNDDCLIGKIQDVILSDSLIFVLKEEQNEILIFDNNGGYLRKIDSQGTGPGEFTIINQMTYNKKRESLSISSSKVIEYDLFGKLKNEFSPSFHVTDLYQFDNGDYLLSRLERLDNPESTVVLSDLNGKIKREIARRNPDYGIDASNYWELIELEDGVHFISPQLDNIIYSYCEDSLVQVEKFNIYPKVSSDFYHSKRGVPILGENYSRTIYRESENWINLIFCNIESVRTFLYNKKLNQYIIGEVFKNDIDDKEQIFFLSSSKNNTFTNYVKSKNDDDNPMIQILHLK